jgi:hypothetical protein
LLGWTAALEVTARAASGDTRAVTAEGLTAKAAAKQATRQALLAAAAQMLTDDPEGDPIGALKPIEVARRAVPPRSNGAFYHIWPTQAAFRQDLLEYMLSPDRIEVGGPTRDIVTDLVAAEGFDLVQAFREIANLNFDGLKSDPSLLLKQSLWSRHHVDAQARELIGDLYRGATAMLIPMYEALLARSGRSLKPPYTLETLATTIMALAEGLHIRWAVQPDAVPDNLDHDADPDNQGRRWSLFASSATMILLGMSEETTIPPGRTQ